MHRIGRRWPLHDLQRRPLPWRDQGRGEKTVSRSQCVPATARFHTASQRWQEQIVPLRKQLKDSAKKARASGPVPPSHLHDLLDHWELTVGIEIHAQLNSSHKLFSRAHTKPTRKPNSILHPFDLALPGTLPVFQPANVLPALRAALILNCTVSPVSRFDRKHYFYHDQPAGYQITQYYEPLAQRGAVTLTPDDGLEGDQPVSVRIKQVQLEQDTARSQEPNDDVTLIDYNRSGQALIEIISYPDLHSPRDAAVYVQKVQALLHAVDAVTTGMEEGGLRADVNVSVRRRDAPPGLSTYAGISGLGQRTEIKNLSSFKGIEDAIIAERNRQIHILEAGGSIEGETRGWSASVPAQTRRLRRKEDSVDYRYMPDADIPPLYISQDLIKWLQETMPPSPNVLVDMLVYRYGLSRVDAHTLVALDAGSRLLYYQDVVDELRRLGHNAQPALDVGKVAGNWVLHELGTLLSVHEKPWSPDLVPAPVLADIIHHLRTSKITGVSAKAILRHKFNSDPRSVSQIIDQENLVFSQLSLDAYEAVAQEVIDSFPDTVKEITEKGKIGRLQFLMGQMMKHPQKGDMRPEEAQRVLRRLVLGGRHS